MTIDDWNSPAERTLQYLAASTPEFEAFNRILLVVHAHEAADRGGAARCTTGVTGYTLPLGLRRRGSPVHDRGDHCPRRARSPCRAQSMRLFRRTASDDGER